MSWEKYEMCTNFNRRKVEKQTLGKPRRRWEDNIDVVVLFRMGVISRLLLTQ